MRWRRLVLPVALLAVTSHGLSACSGLHVLRIDCPGQGSCSPPGLKTSIGRSARTAVLLVHGMGVQTRGYGDALREQLERRLGLRAAGKPDEKPIRKPGSPFDYGLLEVRGYVTPDDRQVQVYELTWSPTTTWAKQKYLGFDSAALLERERVPWNRALKREFVNDRLSDPLLYLGAYGPTMQYPVEQAICWTIKGSLADAECSLGGEEAIPPPHDLEVDIVTFSLGSRIVFDTLVRLAEQTRGSENAEALRRFVLDVGGVFMLANQLPLLELGALEGPEGEETESEAAPGGLAGFLDLRAVAAEGGEEEKGEEPLPLWIVAFSDPNDLLSYVIPEAFAAAHPEARYGNVVVSVATSALLGRLAWPTTAHTGHADSEKVLELLIEGRPQP